MSHSSTCGDGDESTRGRLRALVQNVYSADSVSRLEAVQKYRQAGRAEVIRRLTNDKNLKGYGMPLVDIELIEGVFDKSQKEAMIRKITDVMVEIEGEAMRGVTWVRVHEVASGNWGIGGKGLTTADVKALQAKGS